MYVTRSDLTCQCAHQLFVPHMMLLFLARPCHVISPGYALNRLAG